MVGCKQQGNTFEQIVCDTDMAIKTNCNLRKQNSNESLKISRRDYNCWRHVKNWGKFQISNQEVLDHKTSTFAWMKWSRAMLFKHRREEGKKYKTLFL